jgi:hypothetical protein
MMYGLPGSAVQLGVKPDIGKTRIIDDGRVSSDDVLVFGGLDEEKHSEDHAGLPCAVASGLVRLGCKNAQ